MIVKLAAAFKSNDIHTQRYKGQEKDTASKQDLKCKTTVFKESTVFIKYFWDSEPLYLLIPISFCHPVIIIVLPSSPSNYEYVFRSFFYY